MRAPTNDAWLPLLTSCIAASKKFEVNKQTLFGSKETAYKFQLITQNLTNYLKPVSQFFAAKKSLFIHFKFFTSNNAACQ